MKKKRLFHSPNICWAGVMLEWFRMGEPRGWSFALDHVTSWGHAGGWQWEKRDRRGSRDAWGWFRSVHCVNGKEWLGEGRGINNSLLWLRGCRRKEASGLTSRFWTWMIGRTALPWTTIRVALTRTIAALRVTASPWGSQHFPGGYKQEHRCRDWLISLSTYRF